MTATAFALDPVLDLFDDVEVPAPGRPQLRLIEGDGFGVTPPRGPVASVEVYRRRRFLALLAITTLVLAAAWAAGVSVTSFTGSSVPAAVTPAGVSAAPAVHVVLPGDSYSAIAADLGAADPVAAAQLLRAANGGAELVIGQRLVVDPATLAAVG